jgi:hypothetical protein
MSEEIKKTGSVSRGEFNDEVSSREYLERIMDERDRRYEDKFRAQDTAVAAALSAQEKLTQAAFVASKEAIGKAETAQLAYNERSNEFRQSLDDQAKRVDTTMMSRNEATGKFQALDTRIEAHTRENVDKFESFSIAVGEKIGNLSSATEERLRAFEKDIRELRENQALGAGRDKATVGNQAQTNWGIGIAAAIGLGLLSLGFQVIQALLKWVAK